MSEKQKGRFEITVSHKRRMGSMGLSRIWLCRQRSKNPRPKLKKVYKKGRIGSERKRMPKRSKGEDGKGEGDESQDPAAAPSAIGFAIPPSLDRQIYVVDGTKLRQLSDVSGLCSPGILEHARRMRKPFWKAVRSSLLSVRSKEIVTSETTRSIDLLNVISKNS